MWKLWVVVMLVTGPVETEVPGWYDSEERCIIVGTEVTNQSNKVLAFACEEYI